MMSQASGRPVWESPVLWKAVMWVAVIAVIIGGTRFYAPGTEPMDEPAGEQDYIADPVAHAQEIYEAQVVPNITDNAVDLVTLLQAIAADPEQAGAEHGHQNGDSPFSYPVRVTGTVVEGVFGEAGLEVEGAGDVTVGVQTGPAVTGTAVRDATGLVTFEMFLNQIDFAAVGTELNNRVKETVLADTDFEALMGSEITVLGAFTYDDPSHITITPIQIEAEQ